MDFKEIDKLTDYYPRLTPSNDEMAYCLTFGTSFFVGFSTTEVPDRLIGLMRMIENAKDIKSLDALANYVDPAIKFCCLELLSRWRNLFLHLMQKRFFKIKNL